MVERIERVARVKGIENDFGRRFDRKHGRGNADGDKKKFESTLNAAVKRGEERANRVSDAAELELRNMPLHNIATHSLFYRMSTLDELIGYANEEG